MVAINRRTQMIAVTMVPIDWGQDWMGAHSLSLTDVDIGLAHHITAIIGHSLADWGQIRS